MSTNVRQLAARIGTERVAPRQPAQPQPSGATPRTAFADVLEQVHRTSEAPAFKLSAHAQQRVDQRGISMSPPEQHSIDEAFQSLASSGAQDALLLRADAAFVVNVPNRTIVTAMNQTELNNRVFTNIDSAMIL